jgi:hypothetical protein
MEITINTERQLFIFKGPEFTSALGFDVVYKYCLELARRIKKFGILSKGSSLAPVLESEIGTIQQYRQYENFLNVVGNRKIGTWFSYDTPTAVRKVLEDYRMSGKPIRVFYGDTETGRCWMEENDVLGRVGRSNGKMQVPLIISKNESGGPAILDRCIVRIIDAETRAEVYRHKTYHLPHLEIRAATEALQAKDYRYSVWAGQDGDAQNLANFKTMGKAAQFVAFMTGDCTEQPE